MTTEDKAVTQENPWNLEGFFYVTALLHVLLYHKRHHEKYCSGGRVDGCFGWLTTLNKVEYFAEIHSFFKKMKNMLCSRIASSTVDSNLTFSKETKVLPL